MSRFLKLGFLLRLFWLLAVGGSVAPAMAQPFVSPQPGSGESAVGIDRPDLLPRQRRIIPPGAQPQQPPPPQYVQPQQQPRYAPPPPQQPQYVQPQQQPRRNFGQRQPDYFYDQGPAFAPPPVYVPPPVYIQPPVYSQPPVYGQPRYSRNARANVCRTEAGDCRLAGPSLVNRRCGCFFRDYGRVRGVTARFSRNYEER